MTIVCVLEMEKNPKFRGLVRFGSLRHYGSALVLANSQCLSVFAHVVAVLSVSHLSISLCSCYRLNC